MKHANKVGRILALVIVMCMMMASVANAAETGMLWISVTEPENGNTAALIVTDTTVTDGLIKVTYDPAKLTYQDLTVSNAYVAMHAVNAAQEGALLISWVAPEAYGIDGDAVTLIEISFKGTDGGSLELTGVIHDAQGNEIPIGDVDTTALKAAIEAAKALKEEDYTESSWAALEDALQAAQKTLADPTATQAEVDGAAKKLQDAMAALEKFVPADKTALEAAIADAKALKEGDYTEGSWAALEKALENAEKVLADKRATQQEVDAAAEALKQAMKALVAVSNGDGGPGTGDTAMIGVCFVVALLSVAGIVVLIVLRSKNKQGR